MSRTAMAFLKALQEERYSDAHEMLDNDIRQNFPVQEFSGLLRQHGIQDIALVRRYPGDYAIGVCAGSLSPLLVREDGEVVQITLHLRKAAGRWRIATVEANNRVVAPGTEPAGQLIDRAAAKEIYRQQRQHVEAIFTDHVSGTGCPCDWPEFVYWAGKEHGIGQHDELQNDLVSVALSSGNFEKTAVALDFSTPADSYRCKQCASQWQHFAEEWRMGAIAQRFVRIDARAPNVSALRGLESDRIFSTAGSEQANDTRELSIGEWTPFMSGQGTGQRH